MPVPVPLGWWWWCSGGLFRGWVNHRFRWGWGRVGGVAAEVDNGMSQTRKRRRGSKLPCLLLYFLFLFFFSFLSFFFLFPGGGCSSESAGAGRNVDDFVLASLLDEAELAPEFKPQAGINTHIQIRTLNRISE
ncbi:hypothetical protein F4775DRAFT_164642 [Biscogniauxia sp. FL1348]|nr:hypothetical protein F4775DRAFT_164642 [Biscogniauxia sp. FL1348]